MSPPDLWNRTGGTHADWLYHRTGDAIPAKITKRPDGLISVDLSGPNLVDLLELLDRHAHPGWGRDDGKPNPLAVRLYNAITPAIDKVGASGGTTPQVVINDTTVGAPSPSASSTPKH